MVSDTEQYLLDQMSKLVTAISDNTVTLNRYIERHDHVAADLSKLDSRVAGIDKAQQLHTTTIALHGKQYETVNKITDKIIFATVSVIIGLGTVIAGCFAYITTG